MSFFGRLGGSMPYTKWNELNEDWILNTVKKLSEDWARYYADWEAWKNNTDQAFQDLHDYVMDYFANLDVSEEISEKLNQMAADGSLSELIAPIIPGVVTAWMDEHITPTTPPVDDTLTVTGAAADSKTVGDTFQKTEVYKGVLRTSVDEVLNTSIYFISQVSGEPTAEGAPYAPCWLITDKVNNNIILQRFIPFDSTDIRCDRVYNNGAWSELRYYIDYTLTVRGAAADSKTVGDTFQKTEVYKGILRSNVDDVKDNSIYFVSVTGAEPSAENVPYAPCWVITNSVNENVILQRFIPYNKNDKPCYRVTENGTWNNYNYYEMVDELNINVNNKFVFAKKLSIEDDFTVLENGYYDDNGIWISEQGTNTLITNTNNLYRFLFARRNLTIKMCDNDYATLSTLTRSTIPQSITNVYRWEIPYQGKVKITLTNMDNQICTSNSNICYLGGQSNDSYEVVYFNDEIIYNSLGLAESEYIESDLGLPTLFGSIGENISYGYSQLMIFKKGTIIDTSNTGVPFDLRGFDVNGIMYVAQADTNKHYVFERDYIGRIVYQSKNWKWSEHIPQISLKQMAYFIRIITKETQENNQWKNKVWWCYGTSISDIGLDDNTGNNGHRGKYPLTIEALSQMERHNGAIGSGGYVSTQTHGGNVKTAVLNTPYNTDLVTLEVGPNDPYTTDAGIGNIGDTTDTTIIGAITQCLDYLCNNTRARVVVLSVTGRIYSSNSVFDDTTRLTPISTNRLQFRKMCEKLKELCRHYGVIYIDADSEAIDWGKRVINKTYIDQVHQTYLGGEVSGRFIWTHLKEIENYNELDPIDEQ